MAITDPRKSLEFEELQGFGGIQSTDRLGANGAADMRNFRILSDGSLQKRCGWRIWHSLGAPIRGTWEGVINGINYFFAVSGDTVYSIPNNGESPSPITYLASNEGEVSFVPYCDQLYLLDGNELYRFLSSIGGFSQADGYTPLYGENWHPTEMGPVKEPLNAIQNRIRIHYLNTTGGTTFRLPYTMKQINRVKVGNSYITNYTFNTSTMSVQIPTGTVGGTVEISATLADIFNRRKSVLRSCHAMVYRDPHHETFLCYPETPGYLIFRSVQVSNDMLAASNAVFGNSDALYIPYDMAFSVGSVQHPVTAICQSGEQVLAMNDRNLWAIRHTDDESDDMRIYLLRTDIGCSAPTAVTATGGDPITVSEDGIQRIRFPSGDPDETKIECLSEALKGRLNASILNNGILYLQRSTGELWLRDPNDSDGLVWIYRSANDSWTAFDGIAATHFFEHEGQMGFALSDGSLCLMDETLDTDGGELFEATYVSHYLPFSHPAFQKRSLRAFLGADSFGGEILLTLENERTSFSRLFSGEQRDAPEFFDLRATMGRFRFLRFTVTAKGAARARIHFLSIAANH